jgi:hypothetical protein
MPYPYHPLIASRGVAYSHHKTYSAAPNQAAGKSDRDNTTL